MWELGQQLSDVFLTLSGLASDFSQDSDWSRGWRRSVPESHCWLALTSEASVPVIVLSGVNLWALLTGRPGVLAREKGACGAMAGHQAAVERPVRWRVPEGMGTRLSSSECSPWVDSGHPFRVNYTRQDVFRGRWGDCAELRCYY